MDAAKKAILTQLERDVLPLGGIKSLSTDNHIRIGIRPIEQSFPNNHFPAGCMHEFVNQNMEECSATNGFISILLSKLMQLGGACIWISTSRTLFPVALKAFNIEPEQMIFIDLKKEKDLLYATEEALKCKSIIAVVAEIKDISFKESRRLQLATEQSRVTGFIIRQQPRVLNTIACISRWQITSLPSELNDDMPGIGFPRWNVELLKVRNGKTGSWQLEWSSNHFTEIKEAESLQFIQEERKVG